MDVLLKNRYFRRECLVETWIPYQVCKRKLEWYLHYKTLPNDKNTVLIICSSGWLYGIKKIPENILRENGHHALYPNIIKGRLEVMQYLLSKGCEYNNNMMDWAALFGHLHIVQWLHKHQKEGCTTDAMDSASRNGHLHVIQWLHKHRTEGCTTWAMNNAAEFGHLNVVQWLHEHRTEGCTFRAMDWAAESGHLEVVKFLHGHRTEGCTERAMDNAMENGHTHVVEYLQKHNLV